MIFGSVSRTTDLANMKIQKESIFENAQLVNYLSQTLLTLSLIINLNKFVNHEYTRRDIAETVDIL